MAGGVFQVGSSFLRDKDYLKANSGGLSEQIITPIGIASKEAVGPSTLVNLKVFAVGIPTREAFGSQQLILPGKLNATGIISREAFGTSLVKFSRFIIKPTGIPTAEDFELANVTFGGVVLHPTGIASAYAAGTTHFGVPGGLLIQPIGLISREAFGPNVVVPPPFFTVTKTFGVTTKPIRAKSFIVSSLIAERRGTYRGEFTNLDRDTLGDPQPGDTIKNIERDVEEYYTGKNWLTGAVHFAGESGKAKARVAPTTAGYRAESGSEDKAFRHYTTEEPSLIQQNQGKGNDVASVTVPWPAPTIAGNAAIAILAINMNSGDMVVTPPAGFTPLGFMTLPGQLGLHVYAKQDILDAEPSVVFSSSVVRDMILTIFEYDGMPPTDQAWMLDVYDFSTGTSNAPLTGPTDDEIERENELLLGIVAAKQSPTISAPTNGFSQVATDVTSNATTNRKVAMSVFTKTAYNPEEISMGATLSASQTWIAAVIALRSNEDENFATDTEGRVYGTGFQATTEVGFLFGKKNSPDIHLWRTSPNRLQLDPGDTLAYGAGSELGGNDVQTNYKYGGDLPNLTQSVVNSSLQEVNVIGAAWRVAPVAGRLLVFAVAWEEGSVSNNVTGIAGPAGGWTAGTFTNNSGELAIQVWYKVAAGNDANPSANWTGKRAVACVALEYGHMAAASPFDVQSSQVSTQAQPTIYTGTTGVPVQDVSLAIGFMGNGSVGGGFIATQATPTQGFSTVKQISGKASGGGFVNLGVYHKIVRPALAQKLQVKTTWAAENVGKLLIFKAAIPTTTPINPTKGWTSKFTNQKGGVSPHLVSADYLLNDAGEILELGLGGLASSQSIISVGGNNAEASLMGLGAYTVPVDAWAAGQTYRVFLAGRAAFGTTSRTITVRIKLGGSTIDTVTYTTKAAGASDDEWWVEAFLQCRTLGTGGTVGVFRKGQDRLEAGSVGTKLKSIVTPATVNTQVSNLLDVTAQWNANNGNEFIRADVAYIERVKG